MSRTAAALSEKLRAHYHLTSDQLDVVVSGVIANFGAPLTRYHALLKMIAGVKTNAPLPSPENNFNLELPTQKKKVAPPKRNRKAIEVPIPIEVPIEVPSEVPIPIPISGEAELSGDETEGEEEGIVSGRIRVEPMMGAKSSSPFTFQISSLVCGQLQGSVEQFIKRESTNPGSSCGYTSHIIAENLIKVAATRIFSDPSQCIIELLVNSIDSYRRLDAMKKGKEMPQSIGKFGMGFMSNLWWILQTSEQDESSESAKSTSRMVIMSYPIDQTPFMANIYVGDHNELWCDYYSGVFNTVAQKLGVSIIHDYQHGTHISMVVDNIEHNPSQAFQDQLAKLRYDSSINIVTNSSGKRNGENDVVVLMNYNAKTFTLNVVDYAEGITKDVFFGSLLTPSLSTKSLIPGAVGTPPQIITSQIRDVEGDSCGGLDILVGNIVVATDKMIGDPDHTTPKSRRSTFVVSMPLSTPLPVSRDDIILVKDTDAYHTFLGELMKIVDLCISMDRIDITAGGMTEVIYDEFHTDIEIVADDKSRRGIMSVIEELIASVDKGEITHDLKFHVGFMNAIKLYRQVYDYIKSDAFFEKTTSDPTRYASILTNHSIDFLFKSLEKYASYSAQPAIYAIIDNLRDYVSSIESVVYVPTYEAYGILRRSFPKKTIAVYAGCSVEKVAREVGKWFDKKFGSYGIGMIKGVRIVPAKGIAAPTNGGLAPFLFFPEAWQNNGDVFKIVSASPRLILESTSDDRGGSGMEKEWKWFWENYDEYRRFVNVPSSEIAVETPIFYSIQDEGKNDPFRCIGSKCEKYMLTHPEPGSAREFWNTLRTMLNTDLVRVYDSVSTSSPRGMMHTLSEKCYDILSYVKENRSYYARTNFSKRSIFIIQIITGIELGELSDTLTVDPLISVPRPTSVTKDAEGAYIFLKSHRDINDDSFSKMWNYLAYKNGGSPLRQMLCFRLFMQLYITKSAYTVAKLVDDFERRSKIGVKTGAKIGVKIDDAVGFLKKRMLRLCAKYGVDEKYIIPAKCETARLNVDLSKPDPYASTITFIPSRAMYETPIRTMFSAVYSFISALSDEAVRVYQEDNGMFDKGDTNQLKLFYAMGSALVPIHLVASLLHEPNMEAMVKDYVDSLIAFFTTVSVDTFYGGSINLVFPVDLFHDPILEKYRKMTVDKFASSAPDRFVIRVEQIIEGLNSCLEVCRNEEKALTKTYAFASGFQFCLYTTQMMIKNIVDNGNIKHPISSDTSSGVVSDEGDEDKLVAIGNHIITRCRTSFEGSLVALVVFGYIYDNSDSFTISSIEKWVDMVFTEVRTKYSVEYMNEWRLYQHTHFNADEYRLKYTTTFVTPMRNTLHMCMTYESRPSIQRVTPLTVSRVNTVTVTANQLINYVFSEGNVDTSTRGRLYQFLKNVNKSAPKTSRFQMVQIAANEGTSKPFVDSVLTELIQNSVDAIRIAGVHDIRRTIYLEVTEDLVSVGDAIGIPTSAYLNLWIPFLSSKSGSLIATGEMGTGAFNMYRYPWCKRVITVSNDIEVIATPVVQTVMLPSGISKRVVDIEYAVSIPRGESVSTQGTVITVEINNSLSPEEKISLAMSGFIFSRMQLSTVNVPIRFEDKIINLPRTTLLDRPEGTCYLYSGSQYPSLLLTNGIPMGHLLPFVKSIFGTVNNDDLALEIVIDLNKTHYTSTQSRNRLVVNSQGKHNQSFIDFVKGCLYHALLRKLIVATLHEKREDVYEQYFPNAASKADIEQYRNYGGSTKTIAGNTSFFQYQGIEYLHPHTPQQSTIDSTNDSTSLTSLKSVWSTIYNMMGAAETRDHSISTDLKQKWHAIPVARSTLGGFSVTENHIDLILEELMPSGFVTSDERAPFVLVGRWFLGKTIGEKKQKNVFVVSSSSSSSSSSSKSGGTIVMSGTSVGAITITSDVASSIRTFTQMLKVVSDTYFEIGRQLSSEGLLFTRSPAIEVVADVGSYNALYQPSTHTIRVSYPVIANQIEGYVRSWTTFMSIIADGKKMQAIEYAKTNAEFWNFVGKKMPASTLIHELQHAIFGDNHTGTYAHGDHTFSLNGIRFTASFEKSCDLVYNAIASRGLWTRISERV